MTTYRDRYAELQNRNATVIAVSTDKQAKQAEFRSTIGAPFSFVADTDAALVGLFGIKMPLVKIAKRVTFAIGKGRKILHVERGGAAVKGGGAAEACALW